MTIGRRRIFTFCILTALVLPLLYADAQFGRRGSQYRSQIDALGSTPVATFPIPVLLGVEVSNLTKNFGDPRDGGTRTHEGLDILAPEGTPITSPTDAVVTRVGNGAGSGLYVRTANPGGESFVYMHLVAVADGISAGDVVKRGDILGFVGNTGNASGGPAHLHFEVRQGSATDPYPRLTETFTTEERLAGVQKALHVGGASYAATYAAKFKSFFATAEAAGLAVPSEILAYLSSGNVGAEVAVSIAGVDVALAYNETNAKVVALQEFLITAESGSASARLARAGATGYFGTITREALIEYQRAVGIEASGVVDDATYTQIFALSGEGDSSETIPEDEAVAIAEPQTTTSPASSFKRDLELGSKGEDVRLLQQFLNANGFLVATSAEGSPGNETTYFGFLTEKALAKYQAAHNILPSVGYFGPITRAHLASL